jgi:hypothetical protein
MRYFLPLILYKDEDDRWIDVFLEADQITKVEKIKIINIFNCVLLY